MYKLVSSEKIDHSLSKLSYSSTGWSRYGNSFNLIQWHLKAIIIITLDNTGKITIKNIFHHSKTEGSVQELDMWKEVNRSCCWWDWVVSTVSQCCRVSLVKTIFTEEKYPFEQFEWEDSTSKGEFNWERFERVIWRVPLIYAQPLTKMVLLFDTIKVPLVKIKSPWIFVLELCWVMRLPLTYTFPLTYKLLLELRCPLMIRLPLMITGETNEVFVTVTFWL